MKLLTNYHYCAASSTLKSILLSKTKNVMDEAPKCDVYTRHLHSVRHLKAIITNVSTIATYKPYLMDVLIQAVQGFQYQENNWNDILDEFIAYISETGDTLFPWEQVQKIFMKKLQFVLEESYRVFPYSPGKINTNTSNDDFHTMKQRLLQLAEKFKQTPSTIQRLCELLVEPMKNYKECEKFMRGVERSLMVATWSHPAEMETVSGRTSHGNDCIFNGISLGPSDCLLPSERVTPHWANLPPSPIPRPRRKYFGAPDIIERTSRRVSPSIAIFHMKSSIDEEMENLTLNEISTKFEPEKLRREWKFDRAQDCRDPDLTGSISMQISDDRDEQNQKITFQNKIDDLSENVPADEVMEDSA